MSTNVEKTLIWRKLQIMVNNGTDANGSAKTLSKNFTNVNPDATITQLKTAADALGGLMATSVAGVYDMSKNLLTSVTSEEDGGGAS